MPSGCLGIAAGEIDLQVLIPNCDGDANVDLLAIDLVSVEHVARMIDAVRHFADLQPHQCLRSTQDFIETVAEDGTTVFLAQCQDPPFAEIEPRHLRLEVGAGALQRGAHLRGSR